MATNGIILSNELQGNGASSGGQLSGAAFVPVRALQDSYFALCLKSVEGCARDLPQQSLSMETSGHSMLSGRKCFVVTFQLFYLNEALTPVMRSSTTTAADTAVFNEWLVFPLRVPDVPLDSVIVCNVFGEDGLIAGTSFHVYSLEGVLNTGTRRYRLFVGQRGDAAAGLLLRNGQEVQYPRTLGDTAPASWEMLLRDLQHGRLISVPWLDQLTENHLYTTWGKPIGIAASEGAAPSGVADSSNAFVYITFPTPTQHLPVVYVGTPEVTEAAPAPSAKPITPEAFHANSSLPYVDHFKWAKDHNLCEAKATILSKSLYLMYDAKHQPGPRDRQRLAEIACRPPIQLEPLRSEDVALLWRYRNFITRDARLFIPFMRSVEWHHSDVERREASRLLHQWKGVGLAEVLACLSYYFKGVQPIRLYAIRYLQKEVVDIKTGNLCRFCIQLVQALRYDGPEHELVSFLLDSSLESWEFCSTLYWHLRVEILLEEEQQAQMETAAIHPYRDTWQRMQDLLASSNPHFLYRIRLQQKLMLSLQSLCRSVHSDPGGRSQKMEKGKRFIEAQTGDLFDLFHGISSDPPRVDSSSAFPADTLDGSPVTIPSHPSVPVVGIDSEYFYLYKSTKQPVKLGFLVKPNFLPRRVTASSNIATDAGSPRGEGQVSSSVHHEGDGRCVFMPLTFTGAFRVNQRHDGLHEFPVMFKVSDDVRQDELVVQFIRVADTLLRQDGLDLCLTAYRVLATGPMEGLVELVPGVETLQAVQRDVLKYLRTYNPTPQRLKDAMDRYTRSFAGYSVITYLLGVGDRHLENILISQDGRLLHVDFGYILGSDPRPFPPPMKINREMVEVVGGPDSVGYNEFKTYCCSAYNILRKHAALLLNMLVPMLDAVGMPQITGTGSMNPQLRLLAVQENLRLTLNNAQAAQCLQTVIADSVGSIFANLWDALHAVAQATRV